MSMFVERSRRLYKQKFVFYLSNASIHLDLFSDDEDIRDSLSTASLDTIVERAKSAEPATQLAAVQVLPRCQIKFY